MDWSFSSNSLRVFHSSVHSIASKPSKNKMNIKRRKKRGAFRSSTATLPNRRMWLKSRPGSLNVQMVDGGCRKSAAPKRFKYKSAPSLVVVDPEECAVKSFASVPTQTEFVSSIGDKAGDRDLLGHIYKLKKDVKQYQEAVKYYEAKIFQVSEDLRSTQETLTSEKMKYNKHLQTLTKLVNDHKTQVKTLTELTASKDESIQCLTENLAKSSSSNACRAVAIKSLKDEAKALQKNLSEATKTENILQKSNKELLDDNKKMKSALEDLKNQLLRLEGASSAWEDVVELHVDLLKKEGEDTHFDCSVQASQQLGSLKASYDHRIQLLLKKLFRADRKTKELYLTVERVLKGLHFLLHSDDLHDLFSFDEESYKEGKEELPAYGLVLDLGRRLQACHELSSEKYFSSELCSFILSVFNREGENEGSDVPSRD